MGLSRLQRLLRILAVTLLGASSCSASIPRVLKTNTHCIIVNGRPLCPGDEMDFDSDFVTISAGFPDNSRILPTFTPYWEETVWIGSHSRLTLPGYDNSMKNIFFGEDSCLWGNVGYGPITVNAQLIKCVNQRYVGDPYPNPWFVKNYGPLFQQEQLDLSEPAHNKKGADYFDYRAGSDLEHDPYGKLPPANGLNPFLRGKHQDSQWGTPNVEYPKSAPPVYDTTAPPLSYPPPKIRPIRPYPAPGAGTMPDIYDLEPFLPACPVNKPRCNKRKTPEQIRKEGSVSDPNSNVATTDSPGGSASASASATDNSSSNTAKTDGTTGGDTTATGSSTTDATVPTGIPVASTDGTVTSTDGTVASADGTVASTDGTVSSADSIVASTDGIVASTGAVASTDGIGSSTDTSVASSPTSPASSPITDTTNQDITARAVPNDNALFGKKSRLFLHPRNFRFQMR